jgi:MFS family permease
LSTVPPQKNLAAFFGLRAFSSLQNPVYRIYFLGVLGQFASQSMQTVTGSLLIYRLTGSPVLLGTMSLANAIPMIIFCIFGGAIADRVQKKRLIVIGLFAATLMLLGVALCLVFGILDQSHPYSWLIVIANSFMTGCIFGMMLPARQAIIPEIVSRDHAMNAIALNMLGMNVLSLIGPAIGGFLIDSSGFAACYFCMAALNLYGGIMLLFMPHSSPLNKQTSNILRDILEGFSYVRRDFRILFILTFTTLVLVFSMPFQTMLPIFTDDILKVGAKGLGILMSVSGAGALVGSFVLASLPNRKRGLLLLSSALVVGAALLVFALSRSMTLSLCVVAILGLGQTLRGTVSAALLQSYTEPAYMGRVMSMIMMQWGIMSLGTFGVGLLSDVLPVQWVISGIAIILLVISVPAFLLFPKIRRLD